MTTPHKANDSTLTLSTDALPSSPIVERRRTLLTSTRHEEAAAREAYGRLTPREQKVVRMHTEGWSFKEIGVATGSSRECARQTYHGAVEQMRRLLK